METGIITEPSVWLYGENRIDVVDELFMGWAVGILERSYPVDSSLSLGECLAHHACSWCKIVTHYGYEGYLRLDQGETFDRCTQEDLFERDVSRQTAFVSRPFADVVEEPTVHSRVLVVLNKGSFITVLSQVRNGYTKIRLANGLVGWIPCMFWEWRKETDGFLYDKKPETYFLRQKIFLREGHFDARPPCGLDRERLITCALSYLGTGYRWAGKSAEGIDCSGLTFMCYLMCGILIYRDAKIREGYPISEIPVERAEPGDLLYFPGHIALYLGGQKYIHATGNMENFGCVINSLEEDDEDYREDLAESLLMVGSVKGDNCM